MEKVLRDALCSLVPSGSNGFEGLIAKLLSTITGSTFLLAKSGYQGGRDIQNNATYIECKQYCEDKPPKELLGKIGQSSSNNRLDAWLLVTMADIPATDDEHISNLCEILGIAYVSLFAVNSQQYLSALCILCREDLIGFLQNNATFKKDEKDKKIDIDLLKDYLDSQDLSNLLHEKTKILNAFSLPEIGYAQFRSKTFDFFKTALEAEDKSRSRLGQTLTINSKETCFVERKRVSTFLDDWLSEWGTKRECAIIQGEEGNGKSWSVAKWISLATNKDEAPIILFKNASDCDTNNADDFLKSNIKRLFSNNKADYFWDKKRQAWFTGSYAKPRLMLVLDGINERYDSNWWRILITRLLADYKESIALIVTVRTSYWKENFQLDTYLSTANFEVDGFDDEELEQSLSCINKKKIDFPNSVMPMLRKPRYFRLVSELLPELRDDSLSITPERLYYENIKRRWKNKQNRICSPNEFEDLIIRLTERQIDNPAGYRVHDIKEELKSINHIPDALTELLTSEIIKKELRLYKLPTQQLVVGLALLLCDEISNITNETQDIETVRENVAKWVEPKTGADIQAKVIGAAAIIALTKKEYPHNLKTGLFYEWIVSHNRQHNDSENFYANFHLAPHVYADVAEAVSRNGLLNDVNSKLITFSMIRKITDARVINPVESIISRWFCFIHPKGFIENRREGIDNLEKVISDREISIKSNLQEVKEESIEKYFSAIEVDNDLLLSLRSLGFSIISYSPRKPFVNCLTKGLISNFIMYEYLNESDSIGWVIRSSKDNIAQDLLNKGRWLIDRHALCLKRAGYSLLTKLGTKEAVETLNTMPDNIFPKQALTDWYEEHRKKPCESMFAWTKEQARNCLTNSDKHLQVLLLSRKIGKFIIDPCFLIPKKYNKALNNALNNIKLDELWNDFMSSIKESEFREIELLTLQTSPVSLQIFYKEALKELPKRTGMAFRQLAIMLNRVLLLFDESDQKAIESSWQMVSERLSSCTEEQLNNLRFIEHRLFVLSLAHVGLSLQLALINKRNSNACTSIGDEYFFNSEHKIINPILHSKDNEAVLLTKLIFLSKAKIIHNDDLEKIIPLVKHKNKHIRFHAMQLIYHLENTALINDFIKSGWSYTSCIDDNPNIGHYGSLILAKYGLHVNFDGLANRINLTHVGFAIKSRGLKAEELSKYAQLINDMLDTIDISDDELEKKIYDLSFQFSEIQDEDRITYFNLPKYLFQHDKWPSEYSGQDTRFPVGYLFNDVSGKKQEEVIDEYLNIIKKQIEHGNHWFSVGCHSSSIEDVVKFNGDFVDNWVNKFLSDDNKIIFGRSFAVALCCELLKNNQNKSALDLYKKLYNENRRGVSYKSDWLEIDDCDVALLQSSVNDAVSLVLKERMTLCKTDLELMKLCIGLQYYGKSNWVLDFCDQLLNSEIPYEVALGLTLLGFHDSLDAKENLKTYLNGSPDSWLKKV